MALLPAVCPSALFTESLVYLLSTSLLLHLKRYIFAVPEGAVQRVLSYWFQVMWSGLSEGFPARSKKLSMPWFFVAWVCVQKDYRCVPIHLRHSQLEWMEDENVEVVSWVFSCHITSLIWPGCLKALKQMITNPLLPFWDCRLFSNLKHSYMFILKLFIQLLDFSKLATTWCDIKHGSY